MEKLCHCVFPRDQALIAWQPRDSNCLLVNIHQSPFSSRAIAFRPQYVIDANQIQCTSHTKMGS